MHDDVVKDRYLHPIDEKPEESFDKDTIRQLSW